MKSVQKAGSPPSARQLFGLSTMTLSHLGRRRRFAFWGGLLVSLAAGLVVDCAVGVGLDRGLSTTLVLSCLISIAWALFPEKISISRWSLVLVVSGCLLGLLYGSFWMEKGVGIATTHRFDVWIYLLNVAIIVPIFEEQSVRRLMFLGLSMWVRPLLSAVLVSLIFGWVHEGMFTFAFLVSLLLCVAAYKGIDTVNRAAFHGAYNLVVAIQLLHYAG